MAKIDAGASVRLPPPPTASARPATQPGGAGGLRATNAANDDVQTARPAASTRSGGALAGRFADGFEPAAASRPQQARGEVQALAGPRPAAPPAADARTRERVEAEITRRLGGGANARDIADRMARALGNGDMQRGMTILERGLRNNNLNVGLAGINGPFGGPRQQGVLDGLQRSMGNATGGNVDTVLDNANGAFQANNGTANAAQLRALTDIANLGAQLGVRVDVVAHSNGFNAVRTFLANNPDTRLGNVTLVNPNIPPNLADTQRAFRDMVGRSDRVRLITSLADEAVPLSGAARNGNVWEQQINAAAAAGVQDINVLQHAFHSVDSVSDHLGRQNRPNLDFAFDQRLGRTVPRDPEAWRRIGFTWSPENGFRRIAPPPR